VSPRLVAVAHRIAEQLPLLVDTLAHLGPVLGVDVDAATARACATTNWDGVCGPLPLDSARRMARRCRRLLSDADAALERAGGPADGMRRLAATSLRQTIPTEAMRLSALLRALSLAGCDGTPPPDEPVTLTLLDGGRRVLVAPERGLDPRRRWAVSTTGSTGTMLTAKFGAAPLPDVPSLSAARALAGRLAEQARDAPRWPALPAFVVDLPAPAPMAPFWHAPVRLRMDGAGDIAPRDPRDAIPRPSEPVRCPAPAVPAAAIRDGLRRHEAIAQVRRGTLASGVPFLVAVPRAPLRGVVALVHSLGEGDARSILDLVGDDLASEGLASVAFDLPLHGERARPGEPFLAADDPARFHDNALPAAGDILALAAVVRQCPDATGLPSGVATDRVGLLGYSIGATLALLALAADPALEPAVLLAPTGDIQRWEGLILARRIGIIDRVCIGDEGGGNCTDDATCGPGAVCEKQPGLFLVGPAVLPASRLLIGDAEPLGATALLRPPLDARPILVQYATDDAIVFASQSRQIADALALPAAPAGDDLPSRAVRAWPGGHEFILNDAVRAEAVRFLARQLSRPR